jgi:disulfide bond formation protein DsbB
LVLLIGGILPLGVALLSQYGFGLFPCELCLLQRYPYGVIVLLAALAFVWRRHAQRIATLSIIAIVAWLTTAGIAAYHVGVEQQWWDSATGCTAQTAAGSSIDELRAAILGSPLVSCSDASAVFLGLSMAAWNAVAALGFALYAGYLLRHHPRG